MEAASDQHANDPGGSLCTDREWSGVSLNQGAVQIAHIVTKRKIAAALCLSALQRFFCLKTVKDGIIYTYSTVNIPHYFTFFRFVFHTKSDPDILVLQMFCS